MHLHLTVNIVQLRSKNLINFLFSYFILYVCIYLPVYLWDFDDCESKAFHI